MSADTVTLVFVDSDGTEHPVRAAAGTTVMRAALDNGIAGIVADCGGACTCATCHAYIDPAFGRACGTPGDEERGMLECALDPCADSRLTCQIVVSPALDGMRIHLPDAQT